VNGGARIEKSQPAKAARRGHEGLRNSLLRFSRAPAPKYLINPFDTGNQRGKLSNCLYTLGKSLPGKRIGVYKAEIAEYV
jgi:hypothetical protein